MSLDESTESEEPGFEMPVVEGLTRDRVATAFRWPASLGGKEVFVTGSFCGWDRMLRMSRSGPDGDFFLTTVRDFRRTRRRSAWIGVLCHAVACQPLPLPLPHFPPSFSPITPAPPLAPQPLEPGVIQYKYVVDGTWRVSPAESVIREEGTGSLNNQRLVAPTATLHWKREWEGEEIFITGSFNGWQELLAMHR